LTHMANRLSALVQLHRLAILNAISLGLCTAAFAQQPVTTPESVFSRVSPDVWTVKAALPQSGQFNVGSAVLIAPARFITACHVVDKSVGVTLENEKSSIKVTEVIRDPDNKRDMCLLTTAANPTAPPIVIAPVNTLRVGQRVYVVSSPRGLELSLTDGLISALRVETASKIPIIQSSTPVSAGSSGGGLFDDQGRLIGVVRSVATDTENFAFSYPAEWIVQLPQRYAREIALWTTAMKSAGVTFAADGNVIGSGFAQLEDLNVLPVEMKDKPGVALAYKQFLLLAAPRAFVFTSDGKFGTFSDAGSFSRFVQESASNGVTFRIYAVDNAVVWKK
jgi:serine protease Do